MPLSGTDPHISGIGTMLEVADPSFPDAPGYEGYLKGRVVKSMRGAALWIREPGEAQERASEQPKLLSEPIEAWHRYAATCGVVDGPISLFERYSS